MAATIINLKVAVKLRECEYPDKEVAQLIQKMIDAGVGTIPLEDSVHEELMDDLIDVEVKA